MDHRDIAVLMDGIAPVLRGYVEKAFEPIGARMLALEKRFADLPVPRDPDPVMILQLVEETVAKIPPALPGKDADPALVAELVDKAVAALPVAKDGEPGPAGPPGVDVDPVKVAELVSEGMATLVADEVRKTLEVWPVPKDGAPGEPGKSVTVEELAPLIAQEVAKAVSVIEPPAVDWSEVDKMIGDKVSDAVDALPPAAPGKDADPDLVKEIVAKAIAALPPAKDGADGKEGVPGRDGRDGLPGVQGEKGLDGRNGTDGKDGLGIDDFEVKALDDGRALEFSLRREGAEPVVKRIDLATVLDRGVWREQGYAKGDGVTWGGSFFIAQRATEPHEKPGASDGFRLSVKKGRDGKDGAPGKPGERGPKGEAPARNFV